MIILLVLLPFFLCIPAWIYAAKKQELYSLDIWSNILPIPMLFVLGALGLFKDDDGAPTIAAVVLFPSIGAMITYMRVFWLNRSFPAHLRRLSLICFLILTLAMPLIYVFVIGDKYYHPCEHCEGEACYLMGCGG